MKITKHFFENQEKKKIFVMQKNSFIISVLWKSFSKFRERYANPGYQSINVNLNENAEDIETEVQLIQCGL